MGSNGADSAAPSIVRLSAADISQIKSSTTITRLEDVIIGLVKNSLDANASKIHISFDLSRDDCTVEDNGNGIAAQAFGLDGKLGIPYCTSKCKSGKNYGCNGIFLSAVASQSRLVIASRQPSHISLNSVVFHYSNVRTRFNPAPSGHDLLECRHGTRVSVQNLFGRMPVRVKQRPTTVASQEVLYRMKSLKREIVSLLLAWSEPVTVILREQTMKLDLNVRGDFKAKSYCSMTKQHSKHAGFALGTVLSILSQASFIDADARASWVPVSASKSSLSNKGAISLDAAPSKQCQFISLGIEPLSRSSWHKKMYDQVNQMFIDSTFGAAYDGADANEIEQQRKCSDFYIGPEKGTVKAMKPTRKGVERWPMFYLRFILQHHERDEIGFTDYHYWISENQKLVLDVLRVVVTQWLAEHHFISRGPKQRRMLEGDSLDESSNNKPTTNHQKTILCNRNSFPPQSTLNSSVCQDEMHTSTRSVFSGWSRIKFSRDNFLKDSLSGSANGVSLGIDSDQKLDPSERILETLTSISGADSGTRPCCNASACSDRPIHTDLAHSSSIEEEKLLKMDLEDEVRTWIHPVTNATFCINNRSGATIYQPRLRLSKLPCSDACETESQLGQRWIQNLLDKWNNPVFQRVEPDVILSLSEPVDQCTGDKTRGYWARERTYMPNQNTATKLSVAGLRAARVVSQLDGKFLLVEMHAMLVVIDQHAADERCKVEALIGELCEPVAPLPAIAVRSNLGHTSRIKTVTMRTPIIFPVPPEDFAILKQHASFFALWGILYDIVADLSSETRQEGGGVAIAVKTLPPGISGRCMADPKLIITLLRTEAWKRENEVQRHTENDRDPQQTVKDPNTEGGENCKPWLRKLSNCPGMIIEILNSRACRSAVMFNDKLDFNECQDLVSRLSNCAFPFQCAHGRPSAVPLTHLGTWESDKGDTDFARRYKEWRRGWSSGAPIPLTAQN